MPLPYSGRGFHIVIEGTAEINSLLRQLGPVALQSAGRALHIEAQGIMRKAKANLPRNARNVKRSGTIFPPVHSPSLGTSVTMSFGGPEAPEALYLHEGTGPAAGRAAYRPPSDAFEDWSQRVLGDRRAAFAVAKAVGESGTPPLKYFERAFRESIPGMEQRIAAQLRADLLRRVTKKPGSGRNLTRQLYKGRVRRRVYYPNLRG